MRNESAEDFLSLLKEWRKLCRTFGLIENDGLEPLYEELLQEDDKDGDNDDKNSSDDEVDNEEIFEVERLIAICYGDPKEKGARGLCFKV